MSQAKAGAAAVAVAAAATAPDMAPCPQANCFQMFDHTRGHLSQRIIAKQSTRVKAHIGRVLLLYEHHYECTVLYQDVGDEPIVGTR